MSVFLYIVYLTHIFVLSGRTGPLGFIALVKVATEKEVPKKLCRRGSCCCRCLFCISNVLLMFVHAVVGEYSTANLFTCIR